MPQHMLKLQDLALPATVADLVKEPRGLLIGTSASGQGESSLMYILKFIGLTIVNLFREAWRVPQAMASSAKERRRQNRRDVSEAERLDRIRQPWKYLGKS